MALTDQIPATYADLEAVPPNSVGQLIDGVLHVQPRPVPKHAIAANAIGYEITGPFQRGRDGPGGWVFMTEPELRIDGHALVPDIAGWRASRLQQLPDTAYMELAPDWVCEILSPSTRRIDRTDKLRLYGAWGVMHAWYIDPDARTLEGLAWRDGAWSIVATFKENETVTAPPFDGHSFELGALWPLDERG